MPSFLTPLHEFNQCHSPGGTSEGGEFCSQTTSSPAHTRPLSNARLQASANAYTAAHGLGPVVHPYVTVDQTRAGRIADAYDALPLDDSKNPEVIAAYGALAREVRAQWDHAVAGGMTFEPWTKPGQPYNTSVEMANDVRANRHMYFYPGGSPNALMSKVDAQTGVSTNEMFRAVHDLYGHAAGGYGFGPRGEENAWIAHSQMFSKAARPALTVETRGQNSWVNFGRQNYDAKGNYLNIKAEDRPYATQKLALLPAEFMELPAFTMPTKESQPPFVRKPAPVKPEDELRYPRPPKR